MYSYINIRSVKEEKKKTANFLVFREKEEKNVVSQVAHSEVVKLEFSCIEY